MLQEMEDTDLCGTCLYFVTYDTTGDASTRSEPTAGQKVIDHAYADSMASHLGVVPVFFAGSDEGSFSHYGCEGCGTAECHVYNGVLLYEAEESS